MTNTTKLQITRLPVEAAKLILDKAVKSGAKINPIMRNPDTLIATGDYEHSLLVLPREWKNSGRQPLLFLVNKRWSGVVFDPNNKLIDVLPVIFRREVNAWLNFHFPPANRPAVKLDVARALIKKMDPIVNDPAFYGVEISSGREALFLNKVEAYISDEACSKWLKSLSDEDKISLCDSGECYLEFKKEDQDEETIRRCFNIEEEPSPEQQTAPQPKKPSSGIF